MKRGLITGFIICVWGVAHLFAGVKVVVKGVNVPEEDAHMLTVLWENGNVKISGKSGYQDNEGAFLYKEGRMYVLDEKMKKYMDMTVFMQSMSEENAQEPFYVAQILNHLNKFCLEYELQKTGKKRVIAGYNCGEYKYTDDYGDGVAYFTQDTGLKAKIKKWKDSVKGKKDKPSFFYLPDSPDKGILLGVHSPMEAFEIAAIEERPVTEEELSLTGYSEMNLDEIMNSQSANDTEEEAPDEGEGD